MRCSCIKTDLVTHKHVASGRRVAGGCAIQERQTSHLTYPREIKRCVLYSPHLLFGRFPCKVVTQYRPLLLWPLDREGAPPPAIIGLEALLPDGIDARELHSLARLA